MDNQLLGIVTLLRSALKNEALTLPEDFDLDSASKLLYEHHLLGIAVRGATRCGVPRTHPAMQYLTILFCKEIAKSRLQMQQLDVIYSMFQEHGIQYMPLKGAVLKRMYPQSELRTMGDADLLIRPEQYPQIQELLSSLGLKEEEETDHEHIWHCGDFDLELHKRLIPSYNKDYYAYYGDGWKFARQEGQSSAYALSPEDHFVYLLVHFAKHYRDSTISAKNICDFWIYREVYPNMDEAYIRAELQKLRLLDFYGHILDLLDTWFEGAAPTEAVEILTKTAFQGGICSLNEAQATTSIIRSNQETASLSGSKLKWFWVKVFPPVSTLSQRYFILKKYPVLLPFFWVAQWIAAFTTQPDRLKRGIAVMRADTESISAYEQQLRSVGLEFNLPE